MVVNTVEVSKHNSEALAQETSPTSRSFSHVGHLVEVETKYLGFLQNDWSIGWMLHFVYYIHII